MKTRQENPGQSAPPFALSLRGRVTLAVLIPLVTILGTFMVMQYRLQQKIVMENLTLLASQTALTIEYSIQQAMLSHNRQELQIILDSIGQNEMLREIYLMNPDGKVIFSPGGKQAGKTLSNQDPACLPCHRLAPEQRPASVVVTLPGGERFFRSMNPIQNGPECQGCHPAAQRINGVLLTDIALGPLEASLRTDMWQHLILWGAAILVAVLVVNLVLNHFVLLRLRALSSAIRRLGLGQPSSRLPENQADEIGQVSLAFNDMARQIERREAENGQLSQALRQQSKERGELIRQLITAQEDERRRIARELHDELGQALTALALQTGLAHQYVAAQPRQALHILEQAQNLVGETTEQMYNLILALRPSALDDLGLPAALRAHADRILGEAGVDFHLDASRLPRRLPRDLETVLYRVFQEALTNVSRHARAHSVTITLAQENGTFLGEIVDDGQGFDPARLRCCDPDQPTGLGLMGMQERIAQQNGRLEICSRPGQGTRIQIIIPVPAQEASSV